MEAGPPSDNAAPTNLRDAFKRFGECMDYNEWVTGGLDHIAKTSSSGGAACTSCHNAGTASVYLNEQDPGGTFTHFTQFPYVERLVTGTVNDQGQFDTLVDARRLIDKGTDPRQINANNHPLFNLGDNSGVDPLTLQTNLTNFVSNTLNKMRRINGCSAVVKPDAGAGDGG